MKPFLQMLELLRNKRILVIVAHPDDELLGQGATINKLSTELNCECKAVILGEGITSRAEARDRKLFEKELKIHKQNINTAAEHIGYKSVETHDLPDNRFDAVDLLDVVKIVETEKNAFNPDIIMTHHYGDLNVDHRVTFQAVLTATRPLLEERVTGIITFETPSSTEWNLGQKEVAFNPNLFVSVSEENVKAKTKAMESYEFEKRSYPHPRSSKALEVTAQRWGTVVGADYAEAFQIIRAIVK